MRTVGRIAANRALLDVAVWCVFLAFCPSLAAPQTVTTEYVRAGSNLVAVLHQPPPYFTDLAGTQWAQYQNEANLLKADGITAGCHVGQYCPGSTLTRDAAAVLIIASIYTALKGPGQGGNFTYSMTPYFADVPMSDPDFKFVQKMYELHITAGCGGGLYCPTANLLNSSMAVFAFSAREYVLNGMVSGTFSYPASPQYFMDVPLGNTYFKWVQEAVALQAVNPATGGSGCTAYNFCESNAIYRGDAIPYLTRVILNDLSF